MTGPGTPIESENSPLWLRSVIAVHQKVPAGVSVYCSKAFTLSATSKTSRLVQCLHTGCPSIAPVWSEGNVTPSFS